MANIISLDADMTAGAVLRRMARYGLWLAADQPDAAAVILAIAKRTHTTPEETAARLTRKLPPDGFAIAIRRQWFANILWYTRSVEEVLARCTNEASDTPLMQVLNLHEPDSRRTTPLEAAFQAAGDSVVLDGAAPMGVGPLAIDRFDAPKPARARSTRGAGQLQAVAPVKISAFPRIDAPGYVPAAEPFVVTVGLGREAQAAVTGGKIELAVKADVKTISLEIALMADGLDAPEGWTRTIDIEVANPTEASARFSFIGRASTRPDGLHLTTLDARFIHDGAVVGTASKPLVIGPASQAVLDGPQGPGEPWLAQPPTSTPFTVGSSAPVDLTIELKSDGNAAMGNFTCWLRTPHPVSVGRGPYPVDLGDDAKTFAKGLIDEMRQYSDDPIVDNLLESIGGLVSENLPAEVFTAIGEIAALTQPTPPTVLIVSADAYVPWELAQLPLPLDANRPPYLGAQVLLGRWIFGKTDRPRPDGYPRPAAHPPAELTVQHLAVMVGQYQLQSGLRALPSATEEGTTLVATYDAVALPASRAAVKRLLDANLDKDFTTIGGADAVHFAGHGEYDPARMESSVLLLSDGKPLSSILFRSAKYGGPHQPLMFLNACMVGAGGEILGDLGGFPANCLMGGFGGVLGALWEVADTTAHDIAVKFWERALPPGGGTGESIGVILRDLRSQYDAANPVSTYLAYVYYGHPALTLTREAQR